MGHVQPDEIPLEERLASATPGQDRRPVSSPVVFVEAAPTDVADQIGGGDAMTPETAADVYT
jgi:hypothetical protein